MNTIAIAEAKTADLVAFYNANIVRFPDGTVIKKFADRKTAEKRVADLVEKIASHFPNEETPEGTIPNPNGGESDNQESTGADGAATEGQENNEAAPESDLEVSRMQEEGAPVIEDGEPEDEEAVAQRAAKSHSAFNALQATLAAVNAKNEAEGTKPVVKSSGSKASNSDGVAASWVDSEIRAARLTRDGVSVDLDGKNVGVFKSTREAFRNLRLPDNKHIRFRLRLKEAHRIDGGSETFEHNGKKYVFKIVAVDVE